MRHRRCRDVTLACPTLRTVIEGGVHDGGPSDGSDMRATRDDAGPALEAGLLAELRAALAEHEICSDLREDLAALAVKALTPDSCLWVFVNFGGRYFSWNKAEFQHPVRDIQGAAHRIAIQLNQASTKDEIPLSLGRETDVRQDE